MIEISPDRLCDAATACMRAFHDDRARDWEMLPVQLWDTEVGDQWYRGFLKSEIVQAEAFLHRLGLLPRRTPTPGGPS